VQVSSRFIPLLVQLPPSPKAINFFLPLPLLYGFTSTQALTCSLLSSAYKEAHNNPPPPSPSRSKAFVPNFRLASALSYNLMRVFPPPPPRYTVFDFVGRPATRRHLYSLLCPPPRNTFYRSFLFIREVDGGAAAGNPATEIARFTPVLPLQFLRSHLPFIPLVRA